MNGDTLPLDETLAQRRTRLLRSGKATAEGIAQECFTDLSESQNTHQTILAALKRACLAAYELGIETMGDIALPQVATAEISEAETIEACARSQAVAGRIAALPERTTALAINAVVRLLVERHSARTIQRWPARAEMPVEEADALAAVAEAALGLQTSALVESGLFPTLP